MVNPITALLGALVMVKLLMIDGQQSMVMIIGDFFAKVVGKNWAYFASYLGALGSFFSGSATISNLTFSGIQQSIAGELGLDLSVVLSMQSVGAAMGNMVCINNIVAVCSILGIANQEGFILKRTVVPIKPTSDWAAGGMGCTQRIGNTDCNPCRFNVDDRRLQYMEAALGEPHDKGPVHKSKESGEGA